MTRIKVCGLTREQDLIAAVEGGADLLGFIHVKNSSRFVDTDKLHRLLGLVPTGITSVVVVQDLSIEELDHLRETLHFDYFQFHGSEPTEIVRNFRGYKVFHIQDNDSQIAHIEPMAPFYMVDRQLGDKRGGTGLPFCWANLPNLPGDFFVAGGLHPGNVAELIRRYQPYGIDVSSGVESEPGIKDPVKLSTFLEQARSAKPL